MNKKALNMWMGNRIKQLRLDCEYSQNEFARLLNISRITLVNIENGIQTINSWDLFNMSKLLFCDISKLYPSNAEVKAIIEEENKQKAIAEETNNKIKAKRVNKKAEKV